MYCFHSFLSCRSVGGWKRLGVSDEMILMQKIVLLAVICRISSFLQVTKYRIYRYDYKPFKTLDKSGNNYASSKLEIRWYLYLSSIVVSYAQYQVKESISLEETVLFWVFLVTHIGFLCYIYVNETKPTEITLYINSLYEFDSIYRNITQPNSNNSFQTRMALVLLLSGIFSATVVPIIIVCGLHWTNPCKTTLIGFWLLEECQATTLTFLKIPNAATKLLIFLMNHWIWAFGLQGVQFGIQIINTSAIICIHEFIER